MQNQSLNTDVIDKTQIDSLPISTDEKKVVTRKPRQTTEQKIQALMEKANTLKQKEAEKKRKQLEKRHKAIFAILNSKGLLDVSTDVWSKKIDEISAILNN